MARDEKFIIRKPWQVAETLYTMRLDNLQAPESVGFSRLDNSICYRKFKQKTVIQYRDKTTVETELPVIYSDIDFNWGWSSENGKINGNSNWKGYSVAGLYTTIDGNKVFLAKVTPLLSMSIDAGIRSYIRQDIAEDGTKYRPVLHIFLDTVPSRVIDEAPADDEGLPFGNAPAAPVAENTDTQDDSQEADKATDEDPNESEGAY